jgi:hypothetical protein
MFGVRGGGGGGGADLTGAEAKRVLAGGKILLAVTYIY